MAGFRVDAPSTGSILDAMVQPTPMSELCQLEAAGASDVGRIREHNEDTFLIRQDLGLYLVADGAGGHNAGEVASALAARSLSNYFGSTVRETHDKPEFDHFGLSNGARRMSRGIKKANQDIVAISKGSTEHRGMGTTVVAAGYSARSGLLHIGHVGDSRCYRLRGGYLELLTQDHSLLNDVLEQRPELDESVLTRLPKNVVTRALGMEENVRVSIRSHAVAIGDRYLLCTDGLSKPVPPSAIAEVMAKPAPPAALAAELVQLANAAGGPDNVTVVVLEVTGELTGRKQPGPHVSPAVIAARRPDQASQPEILILGIEELDLDRLQVLPAEAASDQLMESLGTLARRRK